MNYNFADEVRLALARAREEALRRRDPAVDTEHILLSLLNPPSRHFGVWLTRYEARGLPLEDVREALERAVGARGPGAGSVHRGEMPYTGSSKKVLELMMREARAGGGSEVTVEHAFVALAEEPHGLAGRVLRNVGLDAMRLRSNVDLSNLRLDPSATSAASALVRIDDASSQSISEQIVTQVQEAIATGRVAPGDQLPPVRTLADQLDIAPGTVARAYRELERRGQVVTQGARGTRVADRNRKTAPEDERPGLLTGLLRPVAVAAYHMGATAEELREGLEAAMRDIFADGQEPTT